MRRGGGVCRARVRGQAGKRGDAGGLAPVVFVLVAGVPVVDGLVVRALRVGVGVGGVAAGGSECHQQFGGVAVALFGGAARVLPCLGAVLGQAEGVRHGVAAGEVPGCPAVAVFARLLPPVPCGFAVFGKQALAEVVHCLRVGRAGFGGAVPPVAGVLLVTPPCLLVAEFAHRPRVVLCGGALPVGGGGGFVALGVSELAEPVAGVGGVGGGGTVEVFPRAVSVAALPGEDAEGGLGVRQLLRGGFGEPFARFVGVGADAVAARVGLAKAVLGRCVAADGGGVGVLPGVGGGDGGGVVAVVCGDVRAALLLRRFFRSLVGFGQDVGEEVVGVEPVASGTGGEGGVLSGAGKLPEFAAQQQVLRLGADGAGEPVGVVVALEVEHGREVVLRGGGVPVGAGAVRVRVALVVDAATPVFGNGAAVGVDGQFQPGGGGVVFFGKDVEVFAIVDFL